ncbi:MAG: DUF2062 domain-containing protein [Alphaproteobacteria bacterium]|nr:DUF2062 domain-containing protein [Alphaproteobacteria bacterium]
MREAVWPSMGWRRSFHYLKHRVGRLPGTPHEIAGGFAFGAAISCTPFIGFHIILAAAMAFASRASMLAAAIGTVFGNPWTFPVIFTFTYSLGIRVLGGEPITFSIETLSLAHLIENFWSIFLPLLVGGIPTAIVVWTAFYFPLRGLIAKYQHARQARRERKLRLQALHAREHEAAAAAQESGVVLQTERRSGRGESL